ncbi:uncharacterized protein MONOS_17597 [Monocercomonoides exilis]|uniref:uncharacterized protein n=1 Tax=Monocercomonoides exilis TaxID=2049356 RepID=UPI00355AC302|nr:hypothetical protein MONOS_17597 [Monocercomonoides exilis]
MSVYYNGTREITLADIFIKILDELACYSESEQEQKILEMNGLMEKMDKEEFKSVFTEELFNIINKMIEEEKLSMENACLLLKCIGYWNTLKGEWIYDFKHSLLCSRFMKMIIDENEKTEGKDEKLLVDLCEIYVSLSYYFQYELLSICVPCLLKVAFEREKCKETQKEVEMALLALSGIYKLNEFGEGLYFNEVKEIIKFHQEFHNLTHLAYYSAWKFLIYRFHRQEDLYDTVVYELHFVREAGRELEELVKCVDWKKKEEEKREKEMKYITTIYRWLSTIRRFFSDYVLKEENCFALIACLTRLCRSARENFIYISSLAFKVIKKIADTRQSLISVNILVKGGAIDFALEEIQQPTLDTELADECYAFFKKVFRKLREKKYCDIDKAMNKAMRKIIIEKLEEEGFDDIFKSSFHFLPYLRT